MVTKLALYNQALEHLGPVRLASPTENRPDRFALDEAYEGAVAHVLEEGLWFFALRSSMLEPDTDVEARFGLPYTYSFPEDYVRLRAICTDEAQTNEDRSYKREGPYVFSAYNVLYVTYVSNDDLYGWNMGRWPQLFVEAVAAELAYRSGLPITKDRGTKNDLVIIKDRALDKARRKDAVDERVKSKPLSSWANARLGGGRPEQRRQAT